MNTSLLRRGTLALVLSTVGNALLLTAVLASRVIAPFQALSYTPVVFLSAVGVIGATVVYAVVPKQSATPARTVTRIAGVVLVISCLLQHRPARRQSRRDRPCSRRPHTHARRRCRRLRLGDHASAGQ